jgi:phosphate transport system protein
MAEIAADHIVKAYTLELERLQGLMVEMGGMVESQVANACLAVLNKDADAAMLAVEADPKVDAVERDVEQFVIRLLALRQPMAQDLRHIVAALKMTGDLERIGDYAANVAKRSIVLNQYALPYTLSGLAHMSRLVQENLKTIVDAMGENDVEKAMHVWRSDELIDEIYNALFRELVTYMMEDPRNITPCTHLLFVAKNLERIGDHATNIAETIHYAVHGTAISSKRPKGDTSSYAVIRPREGAE